ncbi:glycosyltransferase family 2 protein [Ktedonobacter racemifer]|uniref:Glycosyl transferase family 2 n=1 Tax=Ktedonobacter racemifer DSM 44963 TaxID=485913 RepID=D6TKM9_KTERA|nr:glycosyltransferase family 2 protein [Ktedonobacter racemifer]EFH86329.1 glycosyl transferase family 2 [Ktedonobacter racemifer DSM 44963]
MQQTQVPMNVPAEAAPEEATPAIDLTIVVPVKDEQKSVRILFDKLAEQIGQLGKSFEVIFIDDGSVDDTFEELKKLRLEHLGVVRIVQFRRNFSKTPALVAGFSRSRGQVIFTMDGDLQDDPEEIPRYLAKLDEGYDLVTGWKFPRLDPISKTFPSRIFNWMVSTMTGVHLHDINNGFKAYRRELVEDPHLKLYGEFHRFVPVMAHWRGFKVAEIKVRHHPRKFGASKYGFRRFARGLIDLLNVLFLTSFVRTPLRLFGPLGFFTLFLGLLIDIFVVIRKFTLNQPIHDQPLLFVGILLMIFGVQFILTGLQSEMIRYYAFRPDEEYSIKQELN